MSNTGTIIIKVVNVRVRLLAVGTVMIATMLEVARPGGVDAVREDSADAPVLSRRLCQLVEAERLVHVNPMSYVDKVVAVSLSRCSPSPVSAGLEDQTREVRNVRDIPSAVLEGPESGRDPLDTQLLEDLVDMMYGAYRRPCAANSR